MSELGILKQEPIGHFNAICVLGNFGFKHVENWHWVLWLFGGLQFLVLFNDYISVLHLLLVDRNLI